MSFSNEELCIVYNKLREKGACTYCSYRFLPKIDLGDSVLDTQIIERFENKFGVNKIKTRKSNTCTICLDIFSERVNESVTQQISSSEVDSFDCESYMIALTVPSTCQLRERSVATFLKSIFPHWYGDSCRIPHVGIKEAWRFYFCPRISDMIGKTFNTKSKLIIQLAFHYEDDANECNKMKNWIYDHMSKDKKTDIKQNIEIIEESNFAPLYEFPLSVPNKSVNCESVSVRREALFLAGRYNKFSRVLSQTPWILADGERKMETSVEEIISLKLKKVANAQESRFSSSGREDIDVRMLGNGRPFAVELINAKISKISFSTLRLVENEINNVDARSVLIRDLQIVSRNEMQFLKNGEEKKCKDYSAVCLIKSEKKFEDLVKALPSLPFYVVQKTPLRVMHRRTIAARKKMIHKLSIQQLNIQHSNDCLLIKLNVQTQAGTYVKEFIHGDFGRTFPSISFMFGKVPVDVLNLDVLNVEIDWPKPINYQEDASAINI